tara:strand:+ start:370 stop:951 length:582 start_codon:yes stop_codon:yes gene_type:complete
MKATEIINKVKEVIGIELSEEPIEVKLAQAELENGTIIESESFKEGDEIFIVTEDEKVPLPTGEYKLIDGEILIIEEEGIIKSLGKAEVEEEVEAEDEKEYATKEELEEVKKVVEEIKAILEPKEEEEEMSNETSVKSEEVIKKVVYSSKEKMSEVEKVNHNPEAEAVPNLNLHGQNRIATTLDRVMAKIAKK